ERLATAEREIKNALTEVEARAQKEEWSSAHAALRSAETLLGTAELGAGPLAAEVSRWRANLKVVSRLEELRLRQVVGTYWLLFHADQSYRLAFGASGLAVEKEPDEAVRRIQESAVKAELVVGLH